MVSTLQTHSLRRASSESRGQKYLLWLVDNWVRTRGGLQSVFWGKGETCFCVLIHHCCSNNTTAVAQLIYNVGDVRFCSHLCGSFSRAYVCNQSVTSFSHFSKERATPHSKFNLFFLFDLLPFKSAISLFNTQGPVVCLVRAAKSKCHRSVC